MLWNAAADPEFGEGRFVPSPPLPFPFPSYPFPIPHPFPPLRSRPLGCGCLVAVGLGSAVSSPSRQTLSGAFSAYLGAFWQAFSSKLSLVKLQLLTPPQFFSSDFSFQKCDASAEAYLGRDWDECLSSSPIPIKFLKSDVQICGLWYILTGINMGSSSMLTLDTSENRPLSRM